MCANKSPYQACGLIRYTHGSVGGSVGHTKLSTGNCCWAIKCFHSFNSLSLTWRVIGVEMIIIMIILLIS